MKRVAIIFLAAVLAPSLVLAVLALRAQRDREWIAERQRALLYQGVVDSLSVEVNDYIEARQSEFRTAVDRMLAEEPAATVVAEFPQRIRSRWDLSGVGFVSRADVGGLVAPSGAELQGETLSRFLELNCDFLIDNASVPLYARHFDPYDERGYATADEAGNSGPQTPVGDSLARAPDLPTQDAPVDPSDEDAMRKALEAKLAFQRFRQGKGQQTSSNALYRYNDPVAGETEEAAPESQQVNAAPEAAVELRQGRAATQTDSLTFSQDAPPTPDGIAQHRKLAEMAELPPSSPTTRAAQPPSTAPDRGTTTRQLGRSIAPANSDRQVMEVEAAKAETQPQIPAEVESLESFQAAAETAAADRSVETSEPNIVATIEAVDAAAATHAIEEGLRRDSSRPEPDQPPDAPRTRQVERQASTEQPMETAPPTDGAIAPLSPERLGAEPSLQAETDPKDAGAVALGGIELIEDAESPDPSARGGIGGDPSGGATRDREMNLGDLSLTSEPAEETGESLGTAREADTVNSPSGALPPPAPPGIVRQAGQADAFRGGPERRAIPADEPSTDAGLAVDPSGVLSAGQPVESAPETWEFDVNGRPFGAEVRHQQASRTSRAGEVKDKMAESLVEGDFGFASDAHAAADDADLLVFGNGVEEATNGAASFELSPGGVQGVDALGDLGSNYFRNTVPMVPGDSGRNATAVVSSLAAQRSAFVDLVRESASGAVSRLLGDQVSIFFWYRPPTMQDHVFGAELRVDRLAEILSGVVDVELEVPGEACVALLDEVGTPVARSLAGFETDWARPFVSREIGELLPRWEMAAYLVDPGQLSAVARSQRLQLWLVVCGVLGAIAVGGILLFVDARRRLVEARQKTDFVSNVSHELRTPLTSIRMFADLLRGDTGSDLARRRRYAEVIETEADRLSRLINNVLDFSRMERGDRKFHLQPLDLPELARETLEQLTPQLERAGLKVALKVPVHPVRVLADADALSQVLVNLLSNAEKYAAEGGEVTVVVEPPPHAAAGRAALKVCDRGRGVPRGVEKRIFERFFRTEDSLSSSIPGTGLGLTLARQMALAHGGDLRFEAREGGGSCFVVELPVLADGASPREPDPVAEHGHDRGSRTSS